MKKIIISVLGHDRPGIIAAVARTLCEHECNIEDVSQTILQTEFAGVFIASVPRGLNEQTLLAVLRERLDPQGLTVVLKDMAEEDLWTPVDSEPFVITTDGFDRLGLVAGISELLARHGVNITNLKAVLRSKTAPIRTVMMYEVDIPAGIDQHSFRQALQAQGRELGLDISLQHRNVFEAIHRI